MNVRFGSYSKLRLYAEHTANPSPFKLFCTFTKRATRSALSSGGLTPFGSTPGVEGAPPSAVPASSSSVSRSRPESTLRLFDDSWLCRLLCPNAARNARSLFTVSTKVRSSTILANRSPAAVSSAMAVDAATLEIARCHLSRAGDPSRPLSPGIAAERVVSRRGGGTPRTHVCGEYRPNLCLSWNFRSVMNSTLAARRLQTCHLKLQ